MPARAQDSAPSLRESISGYESAAHQYFQGVPTDWSSRHVVFSKPQPGSDAEDKIQRDPRYWIQQIQRAQLADDSNLVASHNSAAKAAKPRPLPKSHKDWAFSLGNGSVAQNMFPAKFSFNTGSGTLTSANCTSDFAVYGLNVAGATAGQANLVALDNLYSGTSPTGLCGTAPTVLWAYNVTTQTGGTVTTSPQLSLDGKEILFVESYSGGSILHVLRWNSADGGTVASAKAPAQTHTAFSSCTGSTSCLVNIPLGTSGTHTISNSSVFYVYSTDTAYVGDDAGTLYKITPVLGSGTPAVTTRAVGATTKLTGPVFDGSSGLVFVGGANGVLYAVVGSTMALATHSTLQVGDASCSSGNNALADAPLVDGSDSFVFETAMTGADGTHTVVVQAATTGTNSPTGTGWSAAAIADVGTGDEGCGSSAAFPTHTPQFDNTYYSTPSTGHLWVCGAENNGSTHHPELWNVAFSGTPALLGTVSGVTSSINTTNHAQCSPLTEFFNTSDLLYLGEGLSGSFGDLYGFTISGTTATAITGSPVTYPSATGGTSGIIIDNMAIQAQASSIYFTTLAKSTTVCGGTSAFCAVKLTQAGLD
ncbi:hypothetical protein [Candidatus Binatus sp.]|uniref:hypothetical protein n=1 Tax=Candidatus Binatus sp. TaxID=2811406 RepID=UPI003C6B8A5C